MEKSWRPLCGTKLNGLCSNTSGTFRHDNPHPLKRERERVGSLACCWSWYTAALVDPRATANSQLGWGLTMYTYLNFKFWRRTKLTIPSAHFQGEAAAVSTWPDRVFCSRQLAGPGPGSGGDPRIQPVVAWSPGHKFVRGDPFLRGGLNKTHATHVYVRVCIRKGNDYVITDGSSLTACSFSPSEPHVQCGYYVYLQYLRTVLFRAA